MFVYKNPPCQINKKSINKPVFNLRLSVNKQKRHNRENECDVVMSNVNIGDYSVLKASTGSFLAAIWAGMKPAMNARMTLMTQRKKAWMNAKLATSGISV